MKIQVSKKKNIRILVGIAVLAVLATIIAGIAVWESKAPDADPATPGADPQQHAAKGPTGKSTLLLIGLDKFAADHATMDFINKQQNDMNVLLIFDHDKQTYTALHFNRDTMCDVTRTGIGGRVVDTITMQLALAHTYGSGAEDSCLNTVASVQSIVPQVKIDRYASVTMDAVIILNDMVGGVTLQLQQDYTEADARFAQGATITMDGETALEFVRMRSELSDNTNLTRMDRQKQYMSALLDQVMAKAKSQDGFDTEVLLKLNEYLISDASADELSDYADWLSDYTFRGLVSPEGTVDASGEYIEFTIDPASLEAILKDCYY